MLHETNAKIENGHFVCLTIPYTVMASRWADGECMKLKLQWKKRKGRFRGYCSYLAKNVSLLDSNAIHFLTLLGYAVVYSVLIFPLATILSPDVPFPLWTYT